jgi:hypothetical protein
VERSPSSGNAAIVIFPAAARLPALEAAARPGGSPTSRNPYIELDAEARDDDPVAGLRLFEDAGEHDLSRSKQRARTITDSPPLCAAS